MEFGGVEWAQLAFISGLAGLRVALFGIGSAFDAIGFDPNYFRLI